MTNTTDKSGMFPDFNFKLIVIDALLNKTPSFNDELQQLRQDYVNTYEWYSDHGPIQETIDYFSRLVLQQSDLDQVTELCFDGGNSVYSFIQPDWDGEDGMFDVHSIDGFKQLKNLHQVVYISMCDQRILHPLLEQGFILHPGKGLYQKKDIALGPHNKGTEESVEESMEKSTLGKLTSLFRRK